MRRLVLLIIGLLLVASFSATAEESGNTVRKSAESLAAEIAESHGLDPANQDWYRAPRPDMPFKVVTYAGAECVLRFEIIEGTSPTARFAWDFDSDGIIDWQSKYYEVARHIFDNVGQQQATFYVFDVHGQYGSVEIPVEVLSGSGEPRLEPHTLKLSLSGVEERNARADLAVVPDPEKRYFMLLSDDQGHWSTLVSCYQRLIDSLACPPEDIICVARSQPTYPEYQHIIGYGYTPGGVDSAFNFFLANMTENDDLHVISICHGGGQLDSSYVIYDDNSPSRRVYDLVGGRIFAETPDPDLFTIEDNFKLTMGNWCNTGYINTGVGLDEWAGKWSLHLNPDVVYRVKFVETFNGMKFMNSKKRRDDDIYIETIKQYLRGDKNRDGVIDPDRKEVWDYDEDGIPPIALSGDTYVYDEDDWGFYELYSDNEDTLWVTTNVYFDDGSDGTADRCDDCSEYFPTPVPHGTDFDADGVLDRLDVNRDGDWLDSVGVDETGFSGIDNDVALFLDSLLYRYVTVTMYNCFSGGFINDLSRPNVVIATGSPEGTLAYGGMTPVWKGMTGGVYLDEVYPPADDRVVTFLEAYNAIPDFGNDDGRVRLDDNGDRVGHVYPLPADGDGALAAEITWGTLPPVAPQVGPPVLVWPLQDDWTYEVTPTLIWSDTAGADSFKVQWGNEDFSSAGSSTTTDTFFTFNSCISPLPRYDLFWHVRSYKDGFTNGPYCDSVSFDVLVDYDCCVGIRGNADGDPYDSVTTADLDFLYAFLFQGGPLPDCIPEGNVNGTVDNEVPDISDCLYLADYLYRGGPPPVQCPGYICGDADGSGRIDAADAVFLSDYVYHGGPPPEPMDAGDVDCIPGVDEGDLDYLIAYLWEGGPAPCDCD